MHSLNVFHSFKTKIGNLKWNYKQLPQIQQEDEVLKVPEEHKQNIVLYVLPLSLTTKLKQFTRKYYFDSSKFRCEGVMSNVESLDSQHC